METIEAIQWLKKEGLYDKSKIIAPNLKKIFTNCLGVRNERILIVGDKGFPGRESSALLSGAYYLAADEMRLNAKLILQEPKTRGTIADEDVVTSLGNLKEGDIVFLNLSDTLGSIRALGKSFRKLAKKVLFKFVSTPSMGNIPTENLKDLIDAIDVDYRVIKTQHDKIRKILDKAKEIRLVTKAGTDLTMDIEGSVSEAADGNYSEPGSGGNIPAGEVYIPPNGQGVNGVFVIDGSSRNRYRTELIKTPIKLTIKDGSIIDIEGAEEAEALKDTLDWAAKISKHPSSVRRIGEIGIGLNQKAKIIGATIIDEKTFGTAHIAIGSNYWFGGLIYAKIHLDQVCRDADIFVDGKKLEL